MKITFQAFRWECNSQALGLEDFLSMLGILNGRMIKNRVLYIVEDGSLWKGVVLTVKDLKTFTKLVSSQQEIKLGIHELDDSEKIADFNFFIIDKNSGFGLYQHYHHSCSLNLFNVIARNNYRKMKEQMKESEKELLENDSSMSKKDIKLALKRYSGDFIGSIIEREGSFAERVEKLQDAREAEIEFSVLSFNDGAFQAVSTHLKRVKHQLFFLKNTSPLARVSSLASIFKQQSIKKAKVVGIDENGNDIVYRMFNDFDKFATYDYDDMVSELNLNESKMYDSIKQNKIIGELCLVFNKISAALT